MNERSIMQELQTKDCYTGPGSNHSKSNSKYLLGGRTLNITASQQVMASCSGAFITSLFVTPLDVVKVRLQAQQRIVAPSAGDGIIGSLYRCFCSYCVQGAMERRVPQIESISSEGCSHCTMKVYTEAVSANRFTGTMDAMLKICRFEGIRSLWSGFSAALLMTVPATVIYFTVYDRLKYRIGYREEDPSTLYLSALAGAAARIGAATAISPIELVRTKMQSQKYSFSEVGLAVRSAVHGDGLRVLMRGLPPTLMRDVPFSAIYWLGYESMKSCMLRQNAGAELYMSQTLIAGATAGTVAAVLTLPFDVVKTHQQVALGEGGNANQRMSSLRMMKDLYTSRGFTSLYAGFVPRIVKVAPACAIMISSYEFFKSYFAKYNAAQL